MMLQHFSRKTESKGFQARSEERNAQSDRRTLRAVEKAIDDALAALEAEEDGLSQRLNDARDRASVTAGTEHDEYLLREPIMLADLRRFEKQMVRVTLRLKILDEDVANLRFVQAVFYSRFSALTSKQDGS